MSLAVESEHGTLTRIGSVESNNGQNNRRLFVLFFVDIRIKISDAARVIAIMQVHCSYSSDRDSAIVRSEKI